MATNKIDIVIKVLTDYYAEELARLKEENKAKEKEGAR